ncbi:transglycosylase domain-containing protein [Spirillospora sp. NPDC049652]
MHDANEGRGNAFSTLFRLLAASIAAGVLVALIALPGVGSTGMTARDAAENFESMDSKLDSTPPSEKTVVYDASGTQIATFFDRYRESVRLDQVAPIMRTAMVDIEDYRFYHHGALDLKGTIRALASNVESEGTQGGSTLTQQYVKNILVDRARNQKEYQEATAPTAGRKLRELRYALDIERKMSKDKILEGYLNIAYFGAGAYGIQAAAMRYFSKPAAKLTLDQAALLAGITQNPNAYDPIRFPDAAKNRRDTVLRRMQELNHITKAQADAAVAKPVRLNRTDPTGGCESSKAPFFCEYVKYEMLNVLSDGKYWSLPGKRQVEYVNKLNRGGYTVRTTLDMDAQRSLDSALRGTVAPSGNRVAAEAMVQPGTGKLLAVGQSKRFGDSKGRTSLNLAADTAHGGGAGVSAGSTFKVFTLAEALDQGIPVSTTINSPQTTSVNYPQCRIGKLSGGGPWPSVSNAGDSEAGNFNLKSGTWHSVNTFYAELEKRVGVCNAVKMAEKFGLRKATGAPLDPNPSQVLGTNDVDMVHLAAAYAGFAARGRYCSPVAITQILDPQGKSLKLPAQDCHQAVDSSVADEVNSILTGVLTKGTAKNIGGIGRPAAGKTGTCENFTCAVFAGHTPNLAAAVAYWDFRGPWKYPVYGVYGADIPAPIWARSMRGALAGKPSPGFTSPTKNFGDTTKIPDVKGQSAGAATAVLKSAGFQVKVSPRPVNSDQPKGTVASTSPGPGSDADLNSVVILYLSNGSAKKPPPGQQPGQQPTQGANGWSWPF